jgi:adenosylcobyric acid synthase
MIQGTTSDAGKSTLAAALCRLLKGWHRCGPFKPQNMASTAPSPPTAARSAAQALQAQAAGIAPHTDMNPVLLKPSSDTGAQVIIHGKVRADMNARDYHRYKTEAMQAVLQSYERLRAQYACVIVEGAGSPAEINLRARDIANMGFAEAVDCPVIIVADIDRGGVFAHLTGTLDCLSRASASAWSASSSTVSGATSACCKAGWTGWSAHRQAGAGGAALPAWPAPGCRGCGGRHAGAQGRLPRGGAGLPAHQQPHRLRRAARPSRVDLRFIGPGQPVPPADLIILPGSKNTRGDLRWLREHGWDTAIARHLRYGGKLIGICGGFQMLGEAWTIRTAWKVRPAAAPAWACWPCAPN